MRGRPCAAPVKMEVINMKSSIKRVPFPKFFWICMRQWQKENNISDEDLAATFSVSIRTLKTYDVSAHGLTLDKIDNFISAFGPEAFLYVITRCFPINTMSPNTSQYGYPAVTGYVKGDNSITSEAGKIWFGNR